MVREKTADVSDRRHRNRDVPIEAARTQECRIDLRGEIGRPDHDDALPGARAVQFGEQTVDQAPNQVLLWAISPRAPIASISSMNTMHGAFFRASVKMALTAFTARLPLTILLSMSP